jgi:uncharacterized delta-60 repeat protein
MTTSRSRFRTAIAKSITASLINLVLLFPVYAAFTLDPTFNGSGKFTISFPDSSSTYSSQAFRVFGQPNNRIVVGGSFTNRTADGALTGVAFVGLTPGGTLDSTFGSGGTYTDWRSDASTNFRDALMYQDGSTLSMAQVFRLPVGSSTVQTIRLTPSGAVDNVFASNVSIGPCCFGFFTARPVQIAVRNDGKILALITDEGGYFLYRLNPNGTRDTTFGSNGIVPIVFNKFSPTNLVEMIALDDGRILIVGHVPPFDSSSGSRDFFFSRLTEKGSWDKTFGRVGTLRVTIAGGMNGTVRDALVQSDGKILLCGNVSGSDADVWMARFKPNGLRDTTFGNNGVAIHDLAPGGTDVANAVTISADGKIRIAGQLGPFSTSSSLVGRFSANGVFEEQTSFSFTSGQPSAANDISLQPDGKLLVAGHTRNPDTSINGTVFAVARLTE